ncbi:MAG: high-temperature-induced dauer-formation protein-domain-containing protein [Benjaminiella poitrasii]|nr:MAG: high-temperature-induced dauer-formation protein-domain-containing protein [Benjaminiella poitrasii]
MQAILKAPNFPSEQHSINHLLNCCRVLTRLMPFIFESQECAEWEEGFFWTPRQVEKEKKNEDDKPEYDILPCRGELLLTFTIQALFLAGFTVPISLATKESKVNYAIWENGVGSTVPIGSYKDNEANRTEVLRLLVVLLSKSMYIAPSQLLIKEDLWLRFVAANKRMERKVVLVMLCSFMNTVCNYDPTGWMPYNHVIPAGPNKEQLVTLCLTALLILLDYRSPQQADLIRQHDHQQHTTEATSEVWTLENPDAVPKTSVELEAFTPTDQQHANHPDLDNAFRVYMSKLHRPQDFEFLMNGMHRLLTNPMTAVNTYLPGSTKRTNCYIDVMMLCWRLIETNSRFTKYLMETDRSLDLTVTLVFHAMDNKDKITQAGLVRMCAFMLQTLSSNKEYCTKLNKPFTTHSSLPAVIRIYAFNGTYADFLIISIFSLIATTQGKLSSLYPALLLTISNISPYLTHLSVTTATKLVALFHSMSSPSFLFADEHNYQLTMYLLETFNNMINHQYVENPNLMYSIVLHHDYFETLDGLMFEGAMKEVERIRALREKKDKGQQSVDASTKETEQNTLLSKEGTVDKKTEEEPVQPEVSVTEEEEEVKEGEVKKEEEAKEGEPSSAVAETNKDNTQSSTETNRTETEETSVATETPVEANNDNKNTASEPSSSQSQPINEEAHHDIQPMARNGFVPSEAWMSYWKSKLPLATVMAMLKQLVPSVEEKCSTTQVVELEDLMKFIQSVELTELPEEGKSIFIRKFQWGEALVIWFRSMMWGQTYVSSMHDCGAWNGTSIKLFQIKEE